MKRKELQTRLWLSALLLTVSTFFFQVQAQVTIGSDEKPLEGALLDMKTENATSPGAATTTEGGLLFPRVELKETTSLEPMIADSDPNITTLKLEHRGLTVYNLNATTGGFHSAGLYTWDGAKWIRGDGEEWFYLPSFNLDLSTLGEAKVNLYEVYAGQFTKAGNAKFVSSNAEITTVPQAIYAVTELDFVVTDYDDTVITVNGIDPATGEMTYQVLKTDAATDSYINIIYIVK